MWKGRMGRVDDQWKKRGKRVWVSEWRGKKGVIKSQAYEEEERVLWDCERRVRKNRETEKWNRREKRDKSMKK